MYTLLSYNVSCQSRMFADRLQHIIELISNVSPDFICLQEVNEFAISQLTGGFMNMYKIVNNQEIVNDKRSYGEMILVKTKYKIVEEQIHKLFDSQQSRSLHVCKIELDNDILQLCTTQLERGGLADKLRHKQLETLDAFLHKTGYVTFCAVDTNFMQDDHSYSTLKEMLDVYELCADILEGTHQYTLDSIKNFNIKDEQQRERPDRIYITKTQPHSYQCIIQNFELIGMKPFYHYNDASQEEERLMPSDHFGVFVSFHLKSRKSPSTTPSYTPSSTSVSPSHTPSATSVSPSHTPSARSVSSNNTQSYSHHSGMTQVSSSIPNDQDGTYVVQTVVKKMEFIETPYDIPQEYEHDERDVNVNLLLQKVQEQKMQSSTNTFNVLPTSVRTTTKPNNMDQPCPSDSAVDKMEFIDTPYDVNPEYEDDDRAIDVDLLQKQKDQKLRLNGYY